MTKEEEYCILKNTFQLYPNFPSGQVEITEKPDFILHSSNKTIGIEITEIFQDSHIRNSSNIQQLSSDRKQFTEKLIEEYKNLIKFNFTIDLVFSDQYHLKKNDLKNLLSSIFTKTLDHVISLKNEETLIINNPIYLVKEIEEISIQRLDLLTNSFNIQSEGGGVPDLTEDHLIPLVQSKEQKLKNYQKCDQQWLVVKEGNYHAGSFDNISVKKKIESNFDQIIIYRSFRKEIISKVQ